MPGRRLVAVVALALALLALLAGPAALAQSGSFCLVRTPSLQGSYSGDCVAGLASGRGRAQGTDRYEGQWRDGQPTGQGVYTFADGRRFEGEFLDGRVNGRARFVELRGDVLEGEFRDNVLVGFGRLQRADGQVLMVQMQDGALVAVAAATPPAAPAWGSAAPASTAAAAATATAAAAAPSAALQWAPRLDFDDFFPSFLFASATRKPPAAAAPGTPGARSLAPRGDPLAAEALDELARALRRGTAAGAAGATPARSRYFGTQGDATYLGDPWGLVGIRLRNTEPGSVITRRVTVDQIADPTEATFTLPERGDYALYPQMRYRWERLRAVDQPFTVNVVWQVFVNGRPAGEHSTAARVRALHDAPLALATPRGVERTLWVFGAFVTEDAAWLDDLVKEAFAGRSDAAVGYQVGPEGVDRQVQAVYEMLKRRGVKYSSITRSSGVSERVASQIVRFPSESIRTAQANCVDGTVLMASLLRKIGIEPLIVTGPGHALLGYYRRRPAQGQDPDLAFVETTAIGTHDFAHAGRAGLAQVGDWLDKARDDPSFQIMPVVRVRREGVMPIPR